MTTGTMAPALEGPSEDSLSALRTLVDVSLDLSLDEGGKANQVGGTSSKSILIIGMRGAGKTTVGMIIASYLRRSFLDADRVFEKVMGAPIKDFVVKQGWDSFRARETAILGRILSSYGDSHVVALGGGVVEREENRAMLLSYMAQGGLVIHVVRDLDETNAYLVRQATRGTWARLEDSPAHLWERRQAWYSECSNLTIPSVSFPPDRYIQNSLRLKHLERTIHDLLVSVYSLRPSRSSTSLRIGWHAPRTVVITVGSDQHLSGSYDARFDGADVVELVASPLGKTALSARSGPLQNSDHYQRTSLAHQMALRVGSLRMQRLPILYTIRSRDQGGAFVGSRREYIELVDHGLRLGCDLVDIELSLADADIVALMRRNGARSKIVLSHAWFEESHAELRWDDPEVIGLYERARRLGADVVRFSKRSNTLRDNFDLAQLLSRFALVNAVPLTAINVGPLAGLSTALNPILATLPSSPLGTSSSPFQAHQQTLRCLGLLEECKVVDARQARPDRRVDSAALLELGFQHLGLPFRGVLPEKDSNLDTLLRSTSFGGALLSQPLSSLRSELASRGVTVDPDAAAADWVDVIWAEHDHYDRTVDSLAAPSSPLQLHADNIKIKALREGLSRRLSPINIVGPWSSALVLGASGKVGREVLLALGRVGVQTLVAVGCTDDALAVFIPDGAASEVLSVSCLRLGDGERRVYKTDKIGDLDLVPRSVHPPTIVVHQGPLPPNGLLSELPQKLRDSPAGGVLLNIVDDMAVSFTRTASFDAEDVWIEMTESDLVIETARLQFKALTQVALPGDF